jgi:hypothetical protein
MADYDIEIFNFEILKFEYFYRLEESIWVDWGNENKLIKC